MKKKQTVTTNTNKPTTTPSNKSTVTDIDDIFSHQKTLVNKRKSVDGSEKEEQLSVKLQKVDDINNSDDNVDDGYTTDDELKRIAAEVAAAKAKKQRSHTMNSKASSTHSSSAAPSDDLGFTRGPTGASRKYTEEGYRIYSEDELKIRGGGDTADCPFDCSCCF